MEPQEVKHYQVNGRYRVQFERSATKGVDGFKVEANGDSLDDVLMDAKTLKEYAEAATKPVISAPQTEVKEK